MPGSQLPSLSLVELEGTRAYNFVKLTGRTAREGRLWQGCDVTQASDVILYTHPDCAFSSAAKMDYRKRKVAYVEVDLSKEEEKIPDLLALTKGERVTPVIVEGGVVTIGFKGGT